MTAHESAGIGYFHSLSVLQIGEAYLLAGQLDDAGASADRGLKLTRERGERGCEAWALRLLGDIAVQADPPDRESAERHYRQAVARANELGMRPLLAHCHRGLGKLYRCTDHPEQARDHLTIAATMYREMDMGFWLAQTETLLSGSK